MQGWTLQDWTSPDDFAGVDIDGLDIAGLDNDGLDNDGRMCAQATELKLLNVRMTETNALRVVHCYYLPHSYSI